ncbi:Probable nitronate monooxygenase [Linum grandiflorum]
MGWRGILGFDYGIVQAPLGPDISGPELVAAVANAGGLGLLRAPDWEDPEYVREMIHKTRTLTKKPFGIGLVLAFPHEENLKAILESKVKVLQVYWGECSMELVDKAHAAGVMVIPQVGTVESAKKAAESGVDAIIVQGREAGGHVIGQEGLMSLVPRVVDACIGIPVIAAGGIVDARGYVAALALGAQAVCLGTRFVATEESNAHPVYKRKLVELEETEYTDVFGRARWPNAPQRALVTTFMNQHGKSLPPEATELDHPVIGKSVVHGQEKEIRMFGGAVPNAGATGEIENMAMYAGQGVGLINDVPAASRVVHSLVHGAQQLILQQFSA